MHLSLFWKSHCATCSPVYLILYHVTGSCKGPIVSQIRFFIVRNMQLGEETSASIKIIPRRPNKGDNNARYPVTVSPETEDLKYLPLSRLLLDFQVTSFELRVAKVVNLVYFDNNSSQQLQKKLSFLVINLAPLLSLICLIVLPNPHSSLVKISFIAEGFDLRFQFYVTRTELTNFTIPITGRWFFGSTSNSIFLKVRRFPILTKLSSKLAESI